ncbi:MAG: HAMP domain-containing protein, partial [Armatimonadota bacterium]
MNSLQPIRRVRALASRASLRGKIAVAVLLLALSVGLGAILEVRGRVWRSLAGELDRRAVATAEHLAASSADWVATHNEYELHLLVTNVVRTDEDVVYAFIQDRDGAVLAHSFGGSFPIELLRVERSAGAEVAYFETELGRVHDCAQPLLGGLLGTARVGLSEARLHGVAAAVARRIAGWTILLGLVGVVLALLVTRAVLAPLLRLRDAAGAMAQGDFSQRAAATSRDEIGALAQSFNTMADALARTQGELRQSNAELRRKERRLQELLGKTLSAQEAERSHIARELHDETSQCLTSLMVELRVLENLSASHSVRAQAARLRELCSQILDGIQNTLRHLRPKPLEALGLHDAVRGLGEEVAQRFNFDLDFEVVGEAVERDPTEADLALYRIVQEALTNVAKHARASHVSLILEYRPSSLFA